MLKRFLKKRIPAYVVIIFLALAAGSVTFAVWYFKIVYNYNITLQAPAAAADTGSFSYGSWPALDNIDFYDKIREGMVEQKATFIEANLSAMQLTYYVDGAEAEQYKILSKGKPGSWWETPAGLYKVEEKIPSDYSRMAGVYSPYALDFQGNFLIHGWPYYPGGTPVPQGYSGGCIRLSTADAKDLYGMVRVGTPVLVYSGDFNADSFEEQNQGPQINAASYLAVDLKSNFVMAEKNPEEQVPIASLTKLMTALVSVEYINIERTIKITPDMLVKTSIPRLKVGEEYSLYDLLQPLLKESSNEAAVAISDFLGEKHFVDLMNKTAQSIGMKDTHFVDPTGSDWGDVSTAHDLFILAQYLYDNRSFILKMTTNNDDPNVYGPSKFAGELQNFNVFYDDPDFVGGKIGRNGGASDTIMSIFNGEFPVMGGASTSSGTNYIGYIASLLNIIPSSSLEAANSSDDTARPFVFIILGSDNYTQDAQTFLAWIKNNYELRN